MKIIIFIEDYLNGEESNHGQRALDDEQPTRVTSEPLIPSCNNEIFTSFLRSLGLYLETELKKFVIYMVVTDVAINYICNVCWASYRIRVVELGGRDYYSVCIPGIVGGIISSQSLSNFENKTIHYQKKDCKTEEIDYTNQAFGRIKLKL